MPNYSISFDDNQLFYKTFGKGKRTIVFVHGWCCDHSYWQNQFEHFSKNNFIIALDLAGHGKSGKTRDNWTMKSYGRDVHSVIEQLDLRNIVLVGHSMGGPVVVEAAKLAQERVDLVVVVDYFNDIETQMSEEEIQSYLLEMSINYKDWVKSSVRRWMNAGADPNLVATVTEQMSNADEVMALSSMEHIRRYDDDIEISQLKTPLHLINSDLWPTELGKAKKYKENIDATIIAGAGHFLMMELPDEFNSALNKVLNKIEK